MTVNGVPYDLGGSYYAILQNVSFEQVTGGLPNLLFAEVFDAAGDTIYGQVETTTIPPQFPVSITTPFGPTDFGDAADLHINFDCNGQTCAGFIDGDLTVSLVNDFHSPGALDLDYDGCRLCGARPCRLSPDEDRRNRLTCSVRATRRSAGVRPPLLTHVDENLVAPIAQRDPGLLSVQAHDDAVVVLKPEFAVRERRDCKIAIALNPCAWKLRDVAELVDLARRLRRGQGADAIERADQRERIGPAPELRVPLPSPVPETKNWVIVTVPDGLRPRMSAAVGTPDGGISQPASGRRPKRANIAVIAGDRMSRALDTHLYPLDDPAPDSLARWNDKL